MPTIYLIPSVLDTSRHLTVNEETQDCDMCFLNQI